MVKNPAASVGDMRLEFDPWVGKIPWSRKWQPTSVFLSGESRGQRSLVGYSPWGHKELDTTDHIGVLKLKDYILVSKGCWLTNDTCRFLK